MHPVLYIINLQVLYSTLVTPSESEWFWVASNLDNVTSESTFYVGPGFGGLHMSMTARLVLTVSLDETDEGGGVWRDSPRGGLVAIIGSWGFPFFGRDPPRGGLVAIVIVTISGWCFLSFWTTSRGSSIAIIGNWGFPFFWRDSPRGGLVAIIGSWGFPFFWRDPPRGSLVAIISSWGFPFFLEGAAQEGCDSYCHRHFQWLVFSAFFEGATQTRFDRRRHCQTHHRYCQSRHRHQHWEHCMMDLLAVLLTHLIWNSILDRLLPFSHVEY